MRDGPGQHQRRDRNLRDLLPWAPTLLGVCALVVLLVIAGTRFTSSPRVRTLAPAPPFLPVPPPESVSGTVPGLSPGPVSPSARPPARETPGRQVTVPVPERPSRTAARRATTPAAPSPGPVSGTYRVVDSYADGFIGEVLVANSAGSDAGWRAELRFPASVGELVTSWVESAPQATLRRSGALFTWTSGVPVPARGQVALRFHLHRSGTGNLPVTCTVNGRACAGMP